MRQELIIREPVGEGFKFALNETWLQIKELALDGSALIGAVRNAEENEAAIRALRDIKQAAAQLERERKELKEPLLEAGRALDATVFTQKDELDREAGRIAQLLSDFQVAEQRRVAEERRLQQAELDRIEREKQAELAKLEAWKASPAKIEARRQKIEDGAAARTFVAAQPIVPTKAEGQSVGHDWDIEVTNTWELCKFHPDCVLPIKPALSQIKAYLNQGLTIRGIKATRKVVVNVRSGRQQAAIDV